MSDQERSFDPRYTKSWEMLQRAERVIPLGSQTFSKSKINYPEGAAPLFLTHGKGSHAWDVDGNEYVDMVGGLLPLILGYSDPDVNAAIVDQLERGISYSLATEREIELAEMLVETIPRAEMVRFGKNGTDATSGAVRLARAYTGRDRLALGGYHGWQDWYVGATVRNKGVPKAIRDLSDKFNYSDLDSLHALFKAHPGEYAAVLVEPLNSYVPTRDHVEELKELTHAHGALLVFDEVITGFRIAVGGAQEYLGVTPDLASCGKAMANGMPISAVVGSSKIMVEMEEIFFSSTFGGEALSIAAAIATIKKLKNLHVLPKIWDLGDRLARHVSEKISDNGLSDHISLLGLGPWKIVNFAPHTSASKEAIKTYFIKGMLSNGVLITGSHNVCFALTVEDEKFVLGAWEKVLLEISAALKKGDLESNLGCPVIRPVFSVR